MKISWLGHASFLLETAEGVKIITDPYESGSYSGAVGYEPINIAADIVTISHKHSDHNYVQGLGTPVKVEKEGKATIKGVDFEGILSYHDAAGGRARGENIIFIIKSEGLKIVHFGDLGTKDIDYSKFENVDVALIPVGGTFTLDAKEACQVLEKISPRISIPMHFKTQKLGFEIDGVDKFLKICKGHEEKDFLKISLENLSFFKKVLLLKNQL